MNTESILDTEVPSFGCAARVTAEDMAIRRDIATTRVIVRGRERLITVHRWAKRPEHGSCPSPKGK